MKDAMYSIAIACFLFASYSLKAQTSGFATSTDVKIYYRTFGEGIPLLIINGGPGFNSKGFEEVAKHIAEMGYQSILYDQRGTGKSVLSVLDSNHLTLDLMVQDLEALRKTLGLEDWIVLGHSFGGMLANYYATKHPDHIRAIIHSSSGGVDLRLLSHAQNGINQNLSLSEQDSLRYWGERYRASNNPTDRRQFNRFFARAYVSDKKHVPQVAERMMQGDRQINRLLWANMRAIDFDTKDILWSFEKPVLILQGDSDILAPQVAEDAHELFPNSSLHFIKNCGHYGWLDNPKEYWQAIEEFLKAFE
ncbi:MAG: alpha/beta fold hydrolase [Vicingaceae bacterium]